MIATAIIPTANAAAYIRRLCRHFAHKIPATFDDTQGHAPFAMGTCTMQAAPDTLTLRVEAEDQAAVARVQDIVMTHLMQFAHQEQLSVAWVEEDGVTLNS